MKSEESFNYPLSLALLQISIYSNLNYLNHPRAVTVTKAYPTQRLLMVLLRCDAAVTLRIASHGVLLLYVEFAGFLKRECTAARIGCWMNVESCVVCCLICSEGTEVPIIFQAEIMADDLFDWLDGSGMVEAWRCIRYWPSSNLGLDNM